MFVWLAAALAGTPLAVLPFDNHTGDASYDALGLGLADMLVTDLGAVEALDLVERARLVDVLGEIELGERGYLDPELAVKAGKGVGAQLLVVGSITAVQPELRIDARIVDAATGKVQHTAQASGDRAEFFLVEKDLALALLEELGVAVTPREAARVGRVATESFDAFVAYSEGLDALDRGEVDAARKRFDAAIAADSGFGAAGDAFEGLREELAVATAAHEALVAKGVAAVLERLEAHRRGKADASEIPALCQAIVGQGISIGPSDQIRIYEAMLALELEESVVTSWEPPASVNSVAMSQVVFAASRIQDRARILTWGQKFVERYPTSQYFAMTRTLLDQHLNRIERMREAEASGEIEAIRLEQTDAMYRLRCQEEPRPRERAAHCSTWLDLREKHDWALYKRWELSRMFDAAEDIADEAQMRRVLEHWEGPEIADPNERAEKLEELGELMAKRARSDESLARLRGQGRPERYRPYDMRRDVLHLLEVGRFDEAREGVERLREAHPAARETFQAWWRVARALGDIEEARRCQEAAVAADVKLESSRHWELDKIEDLEEERWKTDYAEAEMLEDLRNDFGRAQLYLLAAQSQQRIVDEFPDWPGRKRQDALSTAASSWQQVYTLEGQRRSRELWERLIREFPDSDYARRAKDRLALFPR